MQAAIKISLLFLVLGIYIPGLQGPFIFDDLSNITNNSLIRIHSLDINALWDATNSGAAGPLKRPVAMLSFALNYYMGGGYVSSVFKITNVAIQILCGLMLFEVCKQLIKRVNSQTSESELINPVFVAGVISLLWAIHPINLTSVLYIVQRMTSLSTLFSLGCICAYLAGRKQWITNGNIARASGYFILCGLSLLLALYSKENALLIPLIIGWIEFILFRNAPPWRHLSRLTLPSKRFLYTALTLIVAIAAITIIESLGYRNRPFTMTERVLTEFRVVCLYISLIFIPRIDAFGLFHDDIALSTSLLSPPTTLLSILFLITLAGSALYFRKIKPLYALGVGWFFIGHSLESTFFPLDIAHEHRNHFPSIGLIIAAVSLISITKQNRNKIIVGISTVAIIMGGTTWMRASQWSNYQRLAYFEARHHPDSPAIQALLSNAAHQAGDIDTSITAIKKAMDLAPHETAYALHYQNILAVAGRPIPTSVQQETLRRIQRNKISPSTEMALDHMAGCLSKEPCRPLIPNYIEWADEIIKKRPNIAYYHHIKGKANLAAGKILDALNAFQRAHELDNKYLHPLFEMASILIGLGQLRQAEGVIGWIEEANEKTTFRRDKELFDLKQLLETAKQQQSPATQSR